MEELSASGMLSTAAAGTTAAVKSRSDKVLPSRARRCALTLLLLSVPDSAAALDVQPP